MGKLSPFCALFQDEGAQVAGRSFELVFGEGQDEQGDSGHAAARCSMWPSQQVMRELPEGGVGGKRTRSGRRREEVETVAFITSSGSHATWMNGARQEEDQRTSLRCRGEVVLA